MYYMTKLNLIINQVLYKQISDILRTQQPLHAETCKCVCVWRMGLFLLFALCGMVGG